ncbi:hypothetical protein GTO91_16710 [Heliobacterium undosum]|uniref:Uncharacterized protein n=1 Tax=Heliomicrobium undosum TaxID=121734 RepID=A0A845L4W5_9FIRM|nr:hypothetical protein [Heliomicrobium undosum]MZP31343.1 hypothetical protein [Heliomicrobium undosum]
MIYFKQGLLSFFLILIAGLFLIRIAKVKLYKLRLTRDRNKVLFYFVLFFLYLSLFQFALMSSIFGEHVSCRVDSSPLTEIKQANDFITLKSLRDAGISGSFFSNSELDDGYSQTTGIIEKFERNGSSFYLYRSREDALRAYNKEMRFARLFPLNPFCIQELEDTPNYKFLSSYVTSERDLPLFGMTDFCSRGVVLLVNNLMVTITVNEEWRDLDSNIVVDNSIIRIRSWSYIPSPILNETLRDTVNIITILNSSIG